MPLHSLTMSSGTPGLPIVPLPRGFSPGAEATCQGTVERLTFQNPDSGYAVARFRLAKTRELITIVGNLPGLSKGEDLEVTGIWVSDPRYGPQLEVKRFSIHAPTTAEGLRDYLTTFHNIGTRRADALITAFGEDLPDVIEHDPQRLREVRGLTPTMIRGLRKEWTERAEERNVMIYCATFGISLTQARRIYKFYGSKALRILSPEGNPYRLAEDVWGIGFKKADEIARKLGLSEDDPRRVQAALVYTLERGGDDGHTYLPADVLLTKAAQELPEVGEERLHDGLAALLAEARVIADPTFAPQGSRDLPPTELPEILRTNAPVYLPRFRQTEQAIAADLRPRLEIHDPEKTLSESQQAGLDRYRSRQGIELSDEQQEAVRQALLAPVLLLTGGPGTGKSTCLRLAVDVLEDEETLVALAAPTGRAARRLCETTGRPASTIHRLLDYVSPAAGFGRNRENPLEADVVIVDEVSMLDATLCAALLAALPVKARLILVGDPDQLPSVGAGNVLADLIASGQVPQVHLHYIYRQAQASQIVVNAHRINQGEMPELQTPPGQKSDFVFNQLPEDKDLAPARAAELIVHYATQGLQGKGFDPIRMLQVLTPMHHGPVGTKALNQLLQDALNPKTDRMPVLHQGGREFRLGDRVMQMRNNYDKDVFNGDIGFISAVERQDKRCRIRFFDREVEYSQEDLDEIQHAYAITVHKSQGSEFPVVVMPLVTQHYMMLRRTLLYTALTRARKLAILLGQRKALWLAVQRGRDDEERRYTGLAHRLAHLP